MAPSKIHSSLPYPLIYAISCRRKQHYVRNKSTLRQYLSTLQSINDDVLLFVFFILRKLGKSGLKRKLSFLYNAKHATQQLTQLSFLSLRFGLWVGFVRCESSFFDALQLCCKVSMIRCVVCLFVVRRRL